MESLSRFLDWSWCCLFAGNDGFDQDPPKDRLEAFRGDLYEDLREEIMDSIIENRLEITKYITIKGKIKLELKLSDDEQRDSGIIQF